MIFVEFESLLLQLVASLETKIQLKFETNRSTTFLIRLRLEKK